MKRFLLMVSLGITVGSFAQVKLGLHLGLTRTNAQQIETGFFENDPVFGGRSGLMGGATLQMPMGQRWTYETGLMYMGKSVRYNSPIASNYGTLGHEQIHYLVLNQHWLRRLWRYNRCSVHIGAGLYGAMALSGSYENTLFLFGTTAYEEGGLRIGGKEVSRYRRWDWGGNLLLRVQYDQWQLTGQFSPAFSKYDRYGKVAMRSWGLSLGYLLKSPSGKR